MQVAVRAAPALIAAGLVVAGCGGSATSSSTSGGGVATNPPTTDEITGSSSTSSLATGTGPTQTSGTRTILATLGLNLRAQPSKTAPVLGSLGEGTVVTVIGNSQAGGGWYQVQGETTTGWISADPQFSTARHMTSFASSQHGFSTLYPDTWSFVDNGGASVEFSPQSGGVVQLIVSAAASPAAFGQAGLSGYTASSGNTVEVFGVTGTLRVFDLAQGAVPGTLPPVASPTGTPGASGAPTPAAPAVGSPPPAPTGTPKHLAEILLTVNRSYAMRIDYEYSDPADLDIFTDIYNSMKIDAALPPSPSASPGATATSTST
ncbi:MAG TPA: SH3 domain-containing protein [Candidatus Dormibacteraeota bacterium]|nr:SH3 domain-containing protein [Candidatus Dormibacteraeota bacterium]